MTPHALELTELHARLQILGQHVAAQETPTADPILRAYRTEADHRTGTPGIATLISKKYAYVHHERASKIAGDHMPIIAGDFHATHPDFGYRGSSRNSVTRDSAPDLTMVRHAGQPTWTNLGYYLLAVKKGPPATEQPRKKTAVEKRIDLDRATRTRWTA
ncbi:hypothetical protein HPB52_005645 [Rhipicephalus sanguineus]|uniref:Uncharacterized protein n=1 Tax=Rhipicephalus sanguineus TaxID=34632 RepID=A0A9D4PMP1_RHISA|nr:hypothetical protein HPB52_005645 [Rhipicephalus sanguineus]